MQMFEQSPRFLKGLFDEVVCFLVYCAFSELTLALVVILSDMVPLIIGVVTILGHKSLVSRRRRRKPEVMTRGCRGPWQFHVAGVARLVSKSHLDSVRYQLIE